MSADPEVTREIGPVDIVHELRSWCSDMHAPSESPTCVSRGWTIGATADICGLDHEPSRPPTPHRTRPEGHPAMNTEPRTWNPGDSLILPPADNDNGDHQLDPPPANYADPKDTQP